MLRARPKSISNPWLRPWAALCGIRAIFSNRSIFHRLSGASDSKFGKGAVEVQYSLVLDDSFLQVTLRTRYEPRERYPEGELHSEVAMLSFDRAAGKYVLRQFHNETIFNEYVIESVSADGHTIVMVTRHIENYSPRWRAKETWKILGPDEFVEIFELAAPGKDFVTYVENRFRRKR